MSLTKFKNGKTIVRKEIANSWFGGLYGTSEGNSLDPKDPLVAGHIHDGQHLDGHAQKVHLGNHVTGQLDGANIVTASIGPEKLEEPLSSGGGEDLSETLLIGNVTGGTDIVLTSGDKISGLDAVGAGPADGGPVYIRGGLGTKETSPYGIITINQAPVTVGDTINWDLGGFIFSLTGVSASRTSGNDDFDVRISDVNLMSIEIAAAINDTSNFVNFYIKNAQAVDNTVRFEYYISGPLSTTLEYYTTTTGSNDITPSISTSVVDGALRGRMGSLYSVIGLARGSGSIDLQSRIDLTSYITESDFSTIVGGYNNKIGTPTYINHANSYFQSIVGGHNNTIFHKYISQGAGIVGGNNNYIGYNSISTDDEDGTNFSQIINGYGNKITNYSRASKILNGKNCYIGKHYSGSLFFNRGVFVTGVNNVTTHNPYQEAAYASFNMGYNNVMYGSEAGFINGKNSRANFEGCTLVGDNNVAGGGPIFMWGKDNSTRYSGDPTNVDNHIILLGSNTYSIGENKTAFSCHTEPTLIAGGAQRSFMSRSAVTTNATTETLNNSNGSVLASAFSFLVSLNTAYFIRMHASAFQNAGASGTIGDTASWTITAVVKVGASPATIAIAYSNGTGAPTTSDAGAAGWTLSLSTNTTDGGIKIRVTGEANKTITWTAGMYVSEVRGNV